MGKLIMIAGPTAVGKTKLSIDIAKKFDGEIICADSMQIYKHMNIGTAKVSKEETEGIRHHMVDIISPFEPFTVSDYAKMTEKIIDDCYERGKTPIMVGGTGLYFNSLIYDMDFGAHQNVSNNNDGESENNHLRVELEELARTYGTKAVHNILKELDEDAALRIHENNLRRVIRGIEILKSAGKSSKLSDFSKDPLPRGYDIELICLNMDRALLYERINKRVDMMIDMGLVEEVRALVDSGLDSSYQSMKGIGYKEILEFLEGKVQLDEAIESIKQNSRRYAKRQITWFKRYDFARWIDVLECEDLEKAVYMEKTII